MFVDLNYKDLHGNKKRCIINTECIERIFDEREEHKLMIFLKDRPSAMNCYYTIDDEYRIDNFMTKVLKIKEGF